MNRAKLNVEFAFNLVDKNNSFSYKGSLGPMDLQFVNPAVKPLAMIKINSGTVKQLDFNIQANSAIARGNIGVLYKDLKVSILKVDTTFDNLKKRPIASLFANLFIVKHDNPDNDGEQPRSATVYYTRTSETPFFKFIWQTLLSGLKPCIGLNKKVQDATVALINQQAINKQNRKIKKEQRIKRRTARREKRAEKKLLKSE